MQTPSMKKKHNNSVSASALQIALALAPISISVVLLASSLTPAPTVRSQRRSLGLQYRHLLRPTVVCGSNNIRVEATNSGNDADYPTLKRAFDAINAGVHTGTIAAGVCGDTTEIDSAVLNASGGPSSYTSVTITPAGGGSRTISGAVNGPLVDLSGATNITIDGLLTGGNALTVSNASTSAGDGTSTIRFINGAQNNLVQNTLVLGSATGPVTGTILFHTTTGLGNSNNTITLNGIGPAGSNLPMNAVNGSGTTGAANTNNTISDNNIFDFFNPSDTTNGPRGVLAGTACDAWTITANSFYQTATRTFTAAVNMRAISIENTSGNGFIVGGNFIGGSAPNAGGAAWTQTGSSNNFVGILATVGEDTPTTVQGNVIRNISISTASTSSANAAISFANLPRDKD